MPAKKQTVTLEKIFDKLTEHDKQFESIFKKLTEHDKQFVAIDRNFTALANRLLTFEVSVKESFNDVSHRIGKLETEEQPTKEVEKLKQEYFAITQALKRIESKLGSPDDESPSLQSQINKLDLRVTTLEERVDGMGAR